MTTITIPRETFDYVIAALEFAQKNLPFQSVLVHDAIAAAKAVSEPKAHYEEQPDGTVIPVDPSEMQPQAGANPLWLATHPDGLHDVHTKKSRNWK
jgi:hypothetical protein